MKALPEPAGPHLVGSCHLELCDPDRPCHVLSETPGRRLFVKLWYPADREISGELERERLWEQLRAEPDIPRAVRLLLRPATKVETHSWRGASYSSAAGRPRLLIYNHGMISFASENTSLMEHLASYGYTAVSLQHRDQLAELRALQTAQSGDEKEEQKKLERSIRDADTAERPALWARYYRLASNTNRIVAARALDIRFVLANMQTIFDAMPGAEGAGSPEVFGLLGLSLGGAVATECARLGGVGARCVVNMDGGIYGTALDTPVGGRYLMLYSEPNAGSNAASLKGSDDAGVRSEVIPGTKHLNFHDISMIYPPLKWIGMTGTADPAAVVTRRNELIAEFISSCQP